MESGPHGNHTVGCLFQSPTTAKCRPGLETRSAQAQRPFLFSTSQMPAGFTGIWPYPVLSHFSEMVSSSGDTMETAGAPAQPSMPGDDKDGRHPICGSASYTPCCGDGVSLTFPLISGTLRSIRLHSHHRGLVMCDTLSVRSLVCHPSISPTQV